MFYIIVVLLILTGLVAIGIVATALVIAVPELVIMFIDSFRYRNCHGLQKK